MYGLTEEKIRENLRFRRKVKQREVYVLFDDSGDRISVWQYSDGRPVTPGQDKEGRHKLNYKVF